MKDKIWTLPLVLLAAGIVYNICWDFCFPGGNVDNLWLVFLLAPLVIILAGAVSRRLCSQKKALWGAVFLSMYNCAVYGFQIYLSTRFFGFGMKYLPLTKPLTLPIIMFTYPLSTLLYDIIQITEMPTMSIAYLVRWSACFAPMAFVLICKKAVK